MKHTIEVPHNIAPSVIGALWGNAITLHAMKAPEAHIEAAQALAADLEAKFIAAGGMPAKTQVD